MLCGAIAAVMRASRGSAELQGAAYHDGLFDAQERCMQSALESDVMDMARL